MNASGVRDCVGSDTRTPLVKRLRCFQATDPGMPVGFKLQDLLLGTQSPPYGSFRNRGP